MEVTRVLLGDPPKPLKSELTVSALANDTIRQVRRIQSKYWKSLESSPEDPDEEDFETDYDEETIGRDEDEVIGIRSQRNNHKKSKDRIVDLSQLIKAYRKEMLWKKYRLVELNGLDFDQSSDDEFGSTFDPLKNITSKVGSAFCSENLLEGDSNDTLVFFVHDLGNLKHERYFQSVKAEDELSYVLDSSGRILDWILNDKNYSVLDVNLNSQLQLTKTRLEEDQVTLGTSKSLNPITNSFSTTKDSEKLSIHSYSKSEKDLIFMLWDSYVELSSSKNIVLIGHGNGCELLMSIINERNVTQRVKAVVMALGHGNLPLIEKNRLELKAWYGKNSQVIVPKFHPLYTEDRQRSSGARLGTVERSGESSVEKKCQAFESSLEEM